MNYDSICYNHSCLAQVIIRIDFLEYIDENRLLSPAVEKEVLDSFPRKGMRQLLRFQTMNFASDKNGSRAEQTAREGIQQVFSDANDNKMILSNQFIVLEINSYTTFEDVIKTFVPAFKALLKENQLTSMRTGIRYINFFNDDRIKPQKNYYSSSIGSLLDLKKGNEKCIRSMALDEYIIEDMHLNFRYGMYNPDYPQTIKKSNYVLDYDCFCDEAMEGFDNIMSHIQKGHDSIQKLFEESITNQLRSL